MKEKLCPFKQGAESSFYCDKEKCQWWTSAYTIEGFEYSDCAIVVMAKKNSDGLIPV